MNRLVVKLKEIQPNVNAPLFSFSKDPIETTEEIKKQQKKKHLILRPIVKHGEYDLKQYNEVTSQDKRFLLEVNVMNIYSKPIYNSVNVLCLNCKYSYMMSEIEFKNNKYICEKCKAEGITNFKLHFNATLQCRENLLSNDLITLHLCTYDYEGDNFFGVPPVDAYRNSIEFQKIGNAFKKITESSAYIMALVEQYDGKVLRIVGQYEHLC